MQTTSDQMRAYPGYAISGVVFRGDQVIAASSAFKQIKVWDWIQRKEVAKYTCPAEATALFQDKEGSYLSGESDGTLRRWQFTPLETLGQEIGKQEGAITAIHTFGKAILTGSQSGPLFLWDETGAKRRLLGHAQRVNALLFIDENSALSGSEDTTLKIWDMTQGRCLKTLPAHEKGVSALALHPNRVQFFSASQEGVVKLWDPRKPELCLGTIRPNLGEIRSLAISGQGSHLVLGGERVQLLDLRSLKLSDTGPSSPANCLALQGNRLAIGTTRGGLNVYDLPHFGTELPEVSRLPGAFCPTYPDGTVEQGRILMFEAQQTPIRHLAFHFPYVLTLGSEGKVALHELSLKNQTLEESCLLPAEPALVSVGFLPDKGWIFTLTHQKLSFWSVRGEPIHEYALPSGDPVRSAVAKGSYVLIGTEKGMLHVYHASTKEIRSFNLFKLWMTGQPLLRLDFHDNEVFALDSKGSVHIVSLLSHTIKSYPLYKDLHPEEPFFAYFPPKKTFVLGFKDSLCRFEREEEGCKPLPETSTQNFSCYSLRGDGTLLGGGEHRLSLWNVGKGTPIDSHRQIGQPLKSIASQGPLSHLCCAETRNLFAYNSGGGHVSISSLDLPKAHSDTDPLIRLQKEGVSHLIQQHEIEGLTQIKGAAGAFGQISQGTWERRVVAFKQLGLPQEGREKQRSDFAHEVRVMYDLRNTLNFSTLYGYCLEPLALVMAFEEGGTLKQRIGSNPPLSLIQRCDLALDIVSALLALHDRKVVHTDLKSDNVLLDNQGRGKLADFGLAHVSSYQAGHAISMPGELYWQAPEILNQLHDFQWGRRQTINYAKASDVYSLGLLLYHLFTGKNPFEEGQWVLQEFISHVLGGMRPDRAPFRDLPEPLCTLIDSCLQHDPQKRPTSQDVKDSLKHFMVSFKKAPSLVVTSLETLKQAEFSKTGIITEEIYSTLHSGTWKGCPVTIREFYYKKPLDPSLKESLILEAKRIFDLNHPNLTRLYAICLEGALQLIEEAGVGRPLSEGIPSLSLEGRQHVAVNLAKALAHLHAHKEIYGFLRIEDVGIGPDLSVKVSNVGFREYKTHHSGHDEKKLQKSQTFLAPEVTSPSMLSTHSDIFALGMIFYELFTGTKPFSGEMDFAIARKIRNEQRPSIPTSVDPACKRLIEACWDKDPRKRPEVTLIMTWFTQSPSCPTIAFGATAWNDYFGDVGAEPLLPPNIHDILNAPCPYWPDKKVSETHMLVLIPEKVNGRPLTLKTLSELVHTPKKGNASNYDEDSFFHTYGDTPAPTSHWILMTRDVIPGSRSKSFTAQKALLKGGDTVPKLLDAAAAIFMQNISGGKHGYGLEPSTSTLCEEPYKERQMIVGGLAPGGDLNVYHLNDGGYDCVGVAAARKF